MVCILIAHMVFDLLISVRLSRTKTKIN